MLKDIGKGLFGRLLSGGVLVLGFWLMFQAFQRPNIALGFLAVPTILGGMYLMVKVRSLRPPESAFLTLDQPIDHKEDDLGDSLNGSDKGDQLPP